MGLRIKGGLRVNKNGRAVYSFTHNPSTLRVSATGGMHQIPRAGDADSIDRVVKEFFVAPDGYELVEVDYAGIEALLVGHFAGSERYMRLARLGVHDFANAYALCDIDGVVSRGDLPDLGWSDDDLARSLKEFKRRFPAERQVRKRMVHARNYAVGWKEVQQVLLKEQGKLVPAADIKKFLRFYDELFPELVEWRRGLCEIVGGVGDGARDDKEVGADARDGSGVDGVLEHVERENGRGDPPPLWRGAAGAGWVRNPYGYLHRYNRVVEWERIGGKWQWKFGADAKRLIAFLPQSTAAAIMKESMIRISERDQEILEALRLMIHDSLVAEAPEGRGVEFGKRMAAIMEEPNPELGGLWVGTEVKTGKSWLMD